MRLPMIPAACALILAGCGESPDEETVQLDPDTREPAAMATQPLRPGLWALSETIGEVDQTAMREEQEAEIEEDGDQRGEARTVCLPLDYADRPPAQYWSGDDNICDYDDFSAADGAISATLSCNATPGTLTVTIDGDYGATAFDTAMTVTRSGTGDDDITVSGRLEGEWLGECPDADEE